MYLFSLFNSINSISLSLPHETPFPFPSPSLQHTHTHQHTPRNSLINLPYLELRPSLLLAAPSSSADSTYASHPAALCSFALFRTYIHSLVLDREREGERGRERERERITVVSRGRAIIDSRNGDKVRVKRDFAAEGEGEEK